MAPMKYVPAVQNTIDNEGGLIMGLMGGIIAPLLPFAALSVLLSSFLPEETVSQIIEALISIAIAPFAIFFMS